MRFITTWIRKCLIFVGTVLFLLITSLSVVNAQEDTQGGLVTTNGTGTGTGTNGTTEEAVTGSNSCSDTVSCLTAIMTNTYGILQKVNQLPDYLRKAGDLVVSWSALDTETESTKQIQTDFSTLGNAITQNFNAQNTLQQQLTADMFGGADAGFTVADFNLEQPKALEKVPNLNDLAYGTFIGFPPLTKVQSSPYNYLKYVSGFSMSHTAPSPSFQGRRNDQIIYSNYFNTIMAAESFNGYVLSDQLANYQNGNMFTTTQMNLISKASDSKWIAEITSEQLGKVIRQMLMYESQSYVLLSQMVQTQKQLLTAQIITNSLLIAGNQMNESTMLGYAKEIKPGR